jgi:hypothetical protein
MLPFMARSYIPVGSVEFVVKFMDTYYGTHPKPRNVPEELIQWSDRKIWDAVISKGQEPLPGHWDDHHVKCWYVIKPDVMPKYGRFQVSEEIDFVSEWRAFVFNGELVGLQWYSGDFTRFPPIDAIRDAMRYFKSAPVAYTLDVGMMPIGKWTIVEVHDFFSCGLYGFADHTKLPFMFWRWWKEWERSISLKETPAL